MHKLILNTHIPTFNEYNNKNRILVRGKRKVYSSGNEMKKTIEANILLLARANKFSLPKNTPFYVAIEWYNYNRFDPDNVEFGQKFIFDALQKGGYLKNDSKKEILQPKIHFHLKDKNHPSTYCNVLFFEEKSEFIKYINKNA